MPSPIAHLGAGYAIYRYYKYKLPQDQRYVWRFPIQMTMVIGLSMLPDLDVIPAAIFRDMQTYHNNVSHSLLFAVPIAVFVAGIFQRMYRSHYWVWLLICLVSYDLHVIMDALTAERGVMLFWPLTQDRYASPIKVFYGLQWNLGWFSLHHLWTIFTELLFAVGVMVVANYFDRRRSEAEMISPQKTRREA